MHLVGAEIVRAMSHVIGQGWAMYWGTSRWSSVEISEAYNNCRQFNCPTAICEQSEYHFLCREKIEISLPEVYNKLGRLRFFKIETGCNVFKMVGCLLKVWD